MKNSLRSSLGLTAIIVLCACPIGCTAIIGWIGSVLAPPQKIKAVYRPPKGKRILVFVDDIERPLSYNPIKGDLTRKINRRLEEAGVAAETVPYEKMLDFIAATPNFNHLPVSVAAVGRKLGADLVIYVHIDRFSLKDEEKVGTLWHGRFHARVRVVDVREGVLWPKDRPKAGFVVPAIETPDTPDSSPTFGTKLSEELAERMAERIAMLFYDHRKPPEPEWNLDK